MGQFPGFCCGENYFDEWPMYRKVGVPLETACVHANIALGIFPGGSQSHL